MTGIRSGSASAYSLPSGEVNARSRRTAPCSVTCPPTTLRQCGVLASSRSASQTRAPELRALIAILGSVGPVISTRRSRRSPGSGATVQSPARTSAVSGRKSRVPLRPIAARRAARARSSSSRRGPNRRCRSATNSSASAVRTRSDRSTAGPVTTGAAMRPESRARRRGRRTSWCARARDARPRPRSPAAPRPSSPTRARSRPSGRWSPPSACRRGRWRRSGAWRGCRRCRA